MGDPSLLIQPKIRLLRKVGHAPLRKQFRRRAFFRRFVSHMLRALFAKFEMRSFPIGFRPRAARAIDAVLLIQLQQGPRAAHDAHFAPGKFRRDQRSLRAAGELTDRLRQWRS